MVKQQRRYFVGDFETTVYEGQTETEVWASAVVEFGTEDVVICHSLEQTFQYLKALDCNLCIYYHNLKFDGSFWLPFLLQTLHLKQAYMVINEEPLQVKWLDTKDMPDNSFKYMISSKGQWYSITICTGGHYIEIRDSLKLLPFSVKKIGKDFHTKHKKLEMTYEGYRYAGCEITPQEREYIANDVLVVKEALEMMFQQGHKKLTIGACCMDEFRKGLVGEYDILFPNCVQMELDSSLYGSANVDEYIRKSYRGGWCYVVKGKENKLYGKGTTADVNSLYPSMMSSESGNKYPYGKPTFWRGDYIPDSAKGTNKYFFVRVRTRFYIKKNRLPFIQVKNSLFYDSTEMLETSDIYNHNDGNYYDSYEDIEGNVYDTRMELTLTETDYQLLKDQYDLVDFEIVDGCWFWATVGIFDYYIDKYKKQKLESVGAMRTEAKLFLNNLYGKLATSTCSSFKVAIVKEDGVLGFITVVEHDKKPVYIPCGSAITSYARNFTIRTAQANYHGVNERGFIYADTDSIHCDLEADELVNVPVHECNFCCWKLESSWDKAIFARQKTYIEHVTHEDLHPVDEPYYNVKCAGMPDKCKNEFIHNVEQGTMHLTDFKVGLELNGKLMPKRIKGGIILVNSKYKMRAK